jgi:hypothetical protein
MRHITVPFTMVYADSTSNRFFPVTGWYKAVEIVRARGPYEVQARSGTMNFAWGYQLTDDPSNPGTTGTLIGSSVENPTAVQYPSGFTTIDSSGDQLIRFGWLAKLTGAGATQTAIVGGELEFGRAA